MSVFVLPTLYVWMAASNDKLPEKDPDFDEAEE